MQIRWEEAALSDLATLRTYIAKDNPLAARKIGRRIVEKVNLLTDAPLLGCAGRIHSTRELVITNTPYTIIYHTSADTISILRVFHQARKWPDNL